MTHMHLLLACICHWWSEKCIIPLRGSEEAQELRRLYVSSLKWKLNSWSESLETWHSDTACCYWVSRVIKCRNAFNWDSLELPLHRVYFSYYTLSDVGIIDFIEMNIILKIVHFSAYILCDCVKSIVWLYCVYNRMLWLVNKDNRCRYHHRYQVFLIFLTSTLLLHHKHHTFPY